MMKNKKSIRATAKRIPAILLLSVFIFLLSCSDGGQTQNRESENVLSSADHAFDNNHFSYFVYDTFSNIYNTYKSQNCLEQSGIDITKPLSDQKFWSSDKTWHDYMIGYSIDKLGQCLVLCQAASENGYTLPQSDVDEIEKNVSALASYMEKENVTSAELFKSPSVTLDHIRYVLTMQKTASNYSQIIIDSFEYTDSDYQKYFTDNKESNEYTDGDYDSACVYILSVSKGDFKNENDWENAVSTVENALTSVGRDIESFLAIADAHSDLHISKSGLRTDLIKGNIKEILNIDDFDNWAFIPQRKSGDVGSFTDADGDLYAAFYYDGKGKKAFVVQADPDMRSRDYISEYQKLEQKFPVSVFLDNISGID